MKIAILALGVVLLLGGGAGAYFFFFKDKPAETEALAEGEIPHATEKGGDHGSGNKEGGHGAEYVFLDALSLPIVGDRGITEIVSMSIVIQVEDTHKKDAVQQLEPKLIDAYIQRLYGMVHRDKAMKNGVIQIDVIKKKLYEITNDVVGKDNYTDIYVQVVNQRAM